MTVTLWLTALVSNTYYLQIMTVSRTCRNLGTKSAGGGNRASDAFGTFTLLLDDIGDGSTDNRYQSHAGNNSTQISSSFLSSLLNLLVQVVLSSEIGVNPVRNHRNRYRHQPYGNQTGEETSC